MAGLSSRLNEGQVLDRLLDNRLGFQGKQLAKSHQSFAATQQQLQSEFGMEIVKTVLESFERVLDSMLVNFPQNIFWDLSYLLRDLCASASKDLAILKEKIQLIIKLNEQFGAHSPIRFQYLHDFTFGFDWARWVKKNTDERCHVKPFSLEFLNYLNRRGEELLGLIEQDDTKYPKLADRSMRNPFSFSRTPEDEERLFRALASSNSIPVRQWEMLSTPDWKPDYVADRVRLSTELAISTKQG